MSANTGGGGGGSGGGSGNGGASASASGNDSAAASTSSTPAATVTAAAAPKMPTTERVIKSKQDKTKSVVRHRAAFGQVLPFRAVRELHLIYSSFILLYRSSKKLGWHGVD
jgi:hypothetical protein